MCEVPLLCRTVRTNISHVEPDLAQRIKTFPTLVMKTAQLETVEHYEEKQLACRT